MQVAVRLRHNEKLGRLAVPPTVPLLRYSYDSEAKRARQERIGTVPFWTDELPDELKRKLDLDELADWQAFVNDRNHQQEKALWRFCLNNSVRILAYASKALQAGERPASPTLSRKAAKLFLQSLDEAGYGGSKAAPGRPRKDAEMDADFLLLRTPEDVEQWERLKDQGDIGEVPNFIPPEARKSKAPKKQGFPDYPEGDLIARAMRLAFVDSADESSSEA